MKKIILVLGLMSLFGNVHASKISAMSKLFQLAATKLASKSGLSSHIAKHWSTVVKGKAVHSVFNITKGEAKELATKILSETGEKLTIKKTDKELARLMNKGVNSITLNNGRKLKSYLSRNKYGDYDLVVEKYVGPIGTRGEEFLKIVINRETGDLISMYPRRGMTNLSRHQAYGIGAGFFVASSDEMKTLMQDYDDHILEECDCEPVEPSGYSLLEFVVDMLMPLGLGASNANADESDWLRWRDFTAFEFDRRISAAHEHCNQNNEKLGINESCAWFSQDQLEDLFEEFKVGMNASMKLMSVE